MSAAARRERSPARPAGSRGPGPIAAEVVRALDLAVARRAGSVLPGERPAAGVGEGTELAQLRPYQPGDDVRRLDPAATARTGIPHVRLQVPERQLTVWLVVDLSASMAFGTADRLKSDVAEGAALVVGRLATRRGGRLAVEVSGTQPDRRLPPRSGRRALVDLSRALGAGVGPDGHAAAGGDFARSLGRVAAASGRSGLVVAISDFRDGRDWARPLAVLGARHSVLAIEVRDPREGELPSVGQLSLVDPETGRHVRADTSDRGLRERYAKAERQRREAVGGDLRRSGAHHATLSTEGPWLRELGRTLR